MIFRREEIVAFASLLACLSCLSCARPSSMESFVLRDARGEDGMYRYEMDFTDTLARYDIYLYTRIDGPSRELALKNDIAMAAFWTDPDGEVYREEFYFPIHEGRRTFFSSDYRILYREGVVPSVRGKWTLAIDVVQNESVPVLNGLGVEYKSKKD